MNTDFINQLPTNFHDLSKVWIYQSSRIFSEIEMSEINNLLTQFVSTWKSHGDDVKGFATIFLNQFIVVIADETAAGVSGCSTDSSVRVIKEIENKFGVQLFDRQMLAFYIKDKTQLLPLSQLPPAIENGFITADTLYFNNTILTKKEIETNWLIPIKQSWLSKRITLLT